MNSSVECKLRFLGYFREAFYLLLFFAFWVLFKSIESTSASFRLVLLTSINDDDDDDAAADADGSRVVIDDKTTVGVETTLLKVFLVSARVNKDRQVEEIASFAAA